MVASAAAAVSYEWLLPYLKVMPEEKMGTTLSRRTRGTIKQLNSKWLCTGTVCRSLCNWVQTSAHVEEWTCHSLLTRLTALSAVGIASERAHNAERRLWQHCLNLSASGCSPAGDGPNRKTLTRRTHERVTARAGFDFHQYCPWLRPCVRSRTGCFL